MPDRRPHRSTNSSNPKLGRNHSSRSFQQSSSSNLQEFEEVHSDFVIDLKGRGVAAEPVPHYMSSNDVPLPLGEVRSGKLVGLSSCFNCGGKHVIRSCRFAKDQRCIRFNRHLFDKFLSGKTSGGGRKKPMFSRARYYDVVASDSKALPSPGNMRHSKSADSAVSSNVQFDDYLKSLQRTQSAPETTSKSESAENGGGGAGWEWTAAPKSEAEEGQIEEDNGNGNGSGQSAGDTVDGDEDGQNEREDAPKVGFKFGDEIEGLKIFRTIDEIKTSLKEHQEELDRDQKEIDSRSTLKNKWIRSSDDCGDRRRQNGSKQEDRRRNDHPRREREGERDVSKRSNIIIHGKRGEERWLWADAKSKGARSDSRKRKRDGNDERSSKRSQYDPVDANGDRDYRKSRERGRGQEYDSRSRSRGRESRDYDRDGDRYRSRSRKDRSSKRDRSRDRSRSRGRGYERSGGRGSNGGGHKDQDIDYGFSKKDKINKYIDERYKSSDGRGRRGQDRYQKR